MFRVENKHGWMLVSHALAYVTASKNGISEPEIEDLISLDDKVFGNSKLTTNEQNKKEENQTYSLPGLIEKAYTLFLK